MNSTDAQLELMRRCLDCQATKEEFAQLEDLLRKDSGIRKDYLRYLNIDLALAGLPRQKQQPDTSSSPAVSLLQWRPLASAASAGLIFGLFCASVAWAIVVPRTPAAPIVTAILTESFESPSTPIVEEFPSRPGQWGGDRAQIVGSPPRHRPLDGDSVLKLESASDSKLGYLQQIVDTSHLPQAAEGEMRVVEIIASFLADEPGQRERYTLRVASFEESPEKIGGLWQGVTWSEMDQITLTFSKTGLSTPADAEGWQTLSAVVEVPAGASSLVISLGAGRRFGKSPKTPHYVDDVRAEFRIIPFSERLRPKRK